ncbi:hypothetical protein ADUPG1_000043 [Aduncisulcus paluster]|uniref:Uncharacterized protein n=1 Tax=Aduncisulcus paluster TaxID=2918883 RepID=A0ABQ5K4X1_9EUKA|nr:hypothetical protein ADUPG1_000043 [Aduncisulcus paluster]
MLCLLQVLKDWKSFRSHILSHDHFRNVTKEEILTKEGELIGKRRYREKCVEQAIKSRIPIPSLIQFMSLKFQDFLKEWFSTYSKPVELCASTCYDSAHRVSQRSLSEERKQALSGVYSVILDKTTTRGKSILAILIYNAKKTTAVGYVDIGSIKDEMWTKSFMDEVYKSYVSELASKHQHETPGITKEFNITDSKGIKKIFRNIIWILGCLPAKMLKFQF